jgi:hypothetical protein
MSCVHCDGWLCRIAVTCVCSIVALLVLFRTTVVVLLRCSAEVATQVGMNKRTLLVSDAFATGEMHVMSHKKIQQDVKESKGRMQAWFQLSMEMNMCTEKLLSNVLVALTGRSPCLVRDPAKAPGSPCQLVPNRSLILSGFC